MINFILLTLLYLCIGALIHFFTESKLFEKGINNYNKRELKILFLDIFLWLIFLITLVILPLISDVFSRLYGYIIDDE